MLKAPRAHRHSKGRGGAGGVVSNENERMGRFHSLYGHWSTAVPAGAVLAICLSLSYVCVCIYMFYSGSLALILTSEAGEP